MNLKRTNLIAGCGLGLLLVSGIGCVDALEPEPSDTTDTLDVSDPVSGPLARDAGVADVFPNKDAGDPSCAVDPGSPIPGVPPPPVPSADPEPANGCSGGTIGDGRSCLEVDAIKLKASAACEASGGTLAELYASDNGRCVNGGTTLAKYTCSCADVPRPVKPGESDANAGAAHKCTSVAIGGKVCIPYADIKLKAVELCEAQGLLLTDLKLDGEDCAGGASQSWASCCEPEPPSAASCAGGVIGDGRTCLDLGAIKLKASAACEASGASLVELAGSGDASCPNGALWAKFACSCAGPGEDDPKPAANGLTPPVPGKEAWLN